ncbi:DUF1822 family protein [Spirulina sp. 06S082]|uniref:DUF1822 family protein n=1 Tax=Spirulina sp. 06S082 TaxID=3110248 RepID=UPI002B202B1D|nr:DUF1822 family protein [Spirulina sp. 06S082]MEA5469630.1 DUF1822 family protein [Spirulina sp. 06S082]
MNSGKLDLLLSSLQKVKKMQADRLNLGSDYIDLYIDNVEGDWLENWGQPEKSLQNSSQHLTNSGETNLGEWLKDKAIAEWQKVEDIFTSFPQQKLAFVSSNVASKTRQIERCKRIDLGKIAKARTVVLIVSLRPQSDSTMDIEIALRPLPPDPELPQGLKLYLLSDCGEIMEAIAVEQNSEVISLTLAGKQGKRFQLQAIGEGVNITEDFEI